MEKEKTLLQGKAGGVSLMYMILIGILRTKDDSPLTLWIVKE
jgi:hypothetical protein